MSTWRDIWRYGVIANRFYAENESKGEAAFNKLKEVYDKPLKNEKDGMIRYIMAEAYELKYRQTNKIELKNKALENYENARNLFPVKHWKKVADDSFTRLEKDIKLQDFYNIKIKREPRLDIYAAFNNLLWYAFQKVYTFTHLNDFARYVCLSALARGDSEWPLSLVDFRTVLELEIKQCFPEVIDSFNNDNKYSLSKTIEKLELNKKITSDTRAAFDNIRRAGNIAAHELYPNEKFNKENIVRFIDVLNYFNEFRRKTSVTHSREIPYPLCQIDFDTLIKKLDKEIEKLRDQNYY